MSKKNQYRSITDIAKELNQKIADLEAGKLGLVDVNDLTEISRELYERLVIVRYKALSGDREQVTENSEQQAENSEKEEAAPFALDLTGNKSSSAKASEDKEDKKNALKKKKKKGKKLKGRQERIPMPDQPLPFNNPNPPQKIDMPSKDEEEELKKEIKAEPGQTNLLDIIEETQQEETVNEKLGKESKAQSLADRLSQAPIDDLGKAIGIAQKFMFMNDLFEGENEQYKKAIEKLDNFDDLHQANEYIKEELIGQFDWDTESKAALNFMELVARRYL